MSLNKKAEHLNTLKADAPIYFNLCDDVNAIRYFYSELIGLKENAYRKDSYVDYKIKGKTMMFYQADKIFKRLSSITDSYNEEVKAISWSVQVDKDIFANIVQKLIDSDVEILNEEPSWKVDGYWSFPVLDPMGNQVEVYMEPQTTPVSAKSWADNLSPNKKIARYIYQAIFKKLN